MPKLTNSQIQALLTADSLKNAATYYDTIIEKAAEINAQYPDPTTFDSKERYQEYYKEAETRENQMLAAFEEAKNLPYRVVLSQSQTTVPFGVQGELMIEVPPHAIWHKVVEAGYIGTSQAYCLQYIERI